MPFPAFWCGFLCMEQVTNEKKILRILSSTIPPPLHLVRLCSLALGRTRNFALELLQKIPVVSYN